jgi:hypothetical protein
MFIGGHMKEKSKMDFGDALIYIAELIHNECYQDSLESRAFMTILSGIKILNFATIYEDDIKRAIEILQGKG